MTPPSSSPTSGRHASPQRSPGDRDGPRSTDAQPARRLRPVPELRKRIDEAFCWAQTVGGMAQTVCRGVERVRSRLIPTMAANDLARLHRLSCARGIVALEKMMSKAQIGARRLGQSIDGSTNRKTNIPPRWCLSGLSSGPEGADWQPGECDLMTFRRTGLLGTALRTGAASATLAASPAPARGENGGWRRDRDSNPGEAHTPNGFRDRPVRPLRHLSASVVCDGRSSLRVASLQAGTAADRAWRAVGSGGSAPSRSRGGSCRAAPVRRRSSPPLVSRRASAGSRAPLTRPVGSRISPHSGGPSGSAGSMRDAPIGARRPRQIQTPDRSGARGRG